MSAKPTEWLTGRALAGQGLTEYGLIVALFAIGIIGLLRVVI
jgi:hypothetical protein